MSKAKKLNITEVRSVLFGNVENILDTVSKIRTQDIGHDTLFGDEESSKPTLHLKTEVKNFSDLEVLMQEKNSLGLYVSGSPLGKYQKLLDWVRDATDRSDVHLVLIDKVRKIFTRSNTMMLALIITSADGVNYEGIVFPKAAPRISPLIQEKQIYWVKGKVIEGRKRKNESENSEEGAFEEMPKIAFDDISPFSEGVNALFANEEIKLSINKQKALSAIPWAVLQNHPEKLDDLLAGREVLPDGGPAGATEIRISKKVSAEFLRRIKMILIPTPAPGFEPVELFIERGSEWKKAKGVFFANITKLTALIEEAEQEQEIEE